MQPPRAISLVSRRDPIVAGIARAWRDLTGGRRRGQDHCRRTLLACSGGGDSSGLAVALASAVPSAAAVLVVGHIVHDLRPPAEALADRDAAADLAARLALPFVEAHIEVRGVGGNMEGAARRLRYDALAHLADEAGCGYVATAHQAQDQLETLLMGLLRGVGPRGLRGVATRRRLPGWKVEVIRPALEADRADLVRLCEEAGVQWHEDATNADQSRLRAALRHGIVPRLEVLRPGVSLRAGRTARLIQEAEAVVGDRVEGLLVAGRWDEGFSWPRQLLREERPIVVGELLRKAGSALLGGGLDRLGSRLLAPAIRAIRDEMSDPRVLEPCGLRIEITARRVVLERRER